MHNQCQWEPMLYHAVDLPSVAVKVAFILPRKQEVLPSSQTSSRGVQKETPGKYSLSEVVGQQLENRTKSIKVMANMSLNKTNSFCPRRTPRLNLSF